MMFARGPPSIILLFVSAPVWLVRMTLSREMKYWQMYAGA